MDELLASYWDEEENFVFKDFVLEEVDETDEVSYVSANENPPPQLMNELEQNPLERKSISRKTSRSVNSIKGAINP